MVEEVRISNLAFTNVKSIIGFRPSISVKPDATDMKILQALMKDGRASFTEVARRTSLTTPTVSARVARMTKSGLIKKFVPVLAEDSVDRRVLALVVLKVPAPMEEKLARELAKLEEVDEVYITSGRGLAFKVALDDVRGLQPFLKRRVLVRPGVEVTADMIVTMVVKEEPPTRLPPTLDMKLKCDYCHGEVAGSRPYTLVAGPAHYYFCCKTCRRSYLEEHGPGLAKVRAAG